MRSPGASHDWAQTSCDDRQLLFIDQPENFHSVVGHPFQMILISSPKYPRETDCHTERKGMVLERGIRTVRTLGNKNV